MAESQVLLQQQGSRVSTTSTEVNIQERKQTKYIRCFLVLFFFLFFCCLFVFGVVVVGERHPLCRFSQTKTIGSGQFPSSVKPFSQPFSPPVVAPRDM